MLEMNCDSREIHDPHVFTFDGRKHYCPGRISVYVSRPGSSDNPLNGNVIPPSWLNKPSRRPFTF